MGLRPGSAIGAPTTKLERRRCRRKLRRCGTAGAGRALSPEPIIGRAGGPDVASAQVGRRKRQGGFGMGIYRASRAVADSADQEHRRGRPYEPTFGPSPLIGRDACERSERSNGRFEASWPRSMSAPPQGSVAAEAYVTRSRRSSFRKQNIRRRRIPSWVEFRRLQPSAWCPELPR